MTYKEWSARADLVTEFAQIMRDSTVQLALSVIEEWGLPRQRIRADSPNLMENHALLNARREGYYECLANLKALANPRQKLLDNDLAPWKHTPGTEPEN